MTWGVIKSSMIKALICFSLFLLLGRIQIGCGKINTENTDIEIVLGSMGKTSKYPTNDNDIAYLNSVSQDKMEGCKFSV